MTIDFFRREGRSRPPHPAVQKRVLRVIRDAIVKGWELIRTAPPTGFTLATATEDVVTVALYNTLVNRVLYGRLVPGFTPDLFRVSREPKVYSYDSSSLDKMPDMFFHLITDRAAAFPDQDGVYAECKPIDTSHPVGGHYCDRGLWRFIKGEYGWTMREGMMIGYTASGYVIPQDLITSLAAAPRTTTMPMTGGPEPIYLASGNAHCQLPHWTTHTRNFKYKCTGIAAPEILIHHLWLIRN